MPIHLPPISRRQFLAGTLATGAGLLLPRRLWAAERTVDADRWTLLADIHVWAERDRLVHNLKPAEQFTKARTGFLAECPDTAGILVAGDCAFDKGKPEDYAVLVELLQPVREAGVPVHLALGNHDRREAFWKAFPEAKAEVALPSIDRHVSIVESPRANWFLIDSLNVGSVPGRLGEVQLQWLAAALDSRPDKPALVMAHHNPAGLKDLEDLFKVLAPRRQVKAYMFGHSHRWEVSRRDDLHLVNMPTLVWTPDEIQPRAWLDARLRSDGMTLVVHSLDPSHSAHGQKVDLAWRA
jgi:3',5'-cyclic AMP phosphodiesterase CpdA